MVSLLNLLFERCGSDFSQSVVNKALFASEVCWDYDLRVCCIEVRCRAIFEFKNWFA